MCCFRRCKRYRAARTLSYGKRHACLEYNKLWWCDNRLHSVIDANPRLTVTSQRRRRQGRSDKVKLGPRWHDRVTDTHPESAWQEAKENARG